MIKENRAKVIIGEWLLSLCSVKTVSIEDPLLVRGILVHVWTRIGDLICFLPMLTALRERYPNAEITVFSTESLVQLLLGQPCVDRVICPAKKIGQGHGNLQKKWREWRELMRLARQIRKYRFDFFINTFNWRYKTAFLSLAARKKAIMSNSRLMPYGISAFHPETLYIYRRAETNTSQWLLQTYSNTGLFDVPNDMRPVYFLTETEQKGNALFRKSHELVGKWVIGVHVGANEPQKAWIHWGALMTRVQGAVDDVAFVCFEGPGEEEACEKAIAQASAAGAQCIRVRKPLKEYIACIGVCDMMMCNDSGAGHIAAALDVPGFSIFGYISPREWLPNGRKVMGLYRNKACYASCNYNETHLCEQDTMLCRQAVTLDEAYDNLMIFMQEVRQEAAQRT